MDTDFIVALAKAAVGPAHPEPESEPLECTDDTFRLRLSQSRIVVCQQDRTIGIGGVFWQASIALSYAMDSNVRLFPAWGEQRVLELGCGTALCGLTAWRLGAKEVVLTDMAQCEALVQSSAKATGDAARPPPSGTVTFSKLRWGDPIPEEMVGKFDIVLGSDVTYNTEDHESLLSTLRQDPLPRFIEKAKQLGFYLPNDPVELPLPSPERFTGHNVTTIAEPVMGFSMGLQDLGGSSHACDNTCMVYTRSAGDAAERS